MRSPFFCKKRRETMAEACADCDDCPGTGEDLQTNSFRKNALALEDVPALFQRIT